MRELPENKLDPRIKRVWRLNALIWITLIAIACLIPWVILLTVGTHETLVTAYGLILLACYVLALIVFLGVLPPIRYIRWRYEMSEQYLDIALGIIWRKRYIIPFIRVQNTDTRQGPLMRLFGLASVTVATAAEEHVIPGLDMEVADQLRDRAAELARIAREDV